MKIILTLILVVKDYINGYQVQCSQYTDITCQNSGYCNLIDTICQPALCHKVTDFRACSQEFSGFLYQKYLCKLNPNIESGFRNICIDFNLSTLMWGYLVYPLDKTQESTQITASGQLLSQISTTKYRQQFKSEILTLNIMNAKSNELINIMYGYVQQTNELCDKDIPIQFLEKAIYESMQQIRDDLTITFTTTGNLRKPDFYWVLWGMTDALFLKLRTQQISEYIQYKYLINFGFANLKMGNLQLKTQFGIFEISWVDNKLGYIEVLVMPSEQFGFYEAVSDLIIIRISDLNGYDINGIIDIKWISNNYYLNNNKFFLIDSVQMTILENDLSACQTYYCLVSQQKLSKKTAFIVGSNSLIDCSNRYYSACRLRPGFCTWSYSDQKCIQN